ncbi:aldo/keto reductase [Candidatus Methylacidiphilum fumarolicum]|uniref:Predicted oxidoreductase n=2 Tax=Candidatus Methylacidiphilum fumarolicum TaxID=591154 RepID=I0K0X1_METFB|nr:aldo/keto reductase [Candidatus Methylacidiphilum fumarolicum]MBW6413988.1 aldo/keto reductase [Candidatus Methylacidiphilum fumarolicum]TFE70528.1 aldo/keto reductase [Candidatus Methylacidiphilum fumarolicum]TFE74758.1 aldo/keto reductase [Candidatus Methylacidiphilum fumarolicum]TFE76004.1 aldo/keto reductase [Candidatus Methylacidiphilum fumarolicum]TFE76415.1 aldo/keto reductase [Candidatus Methylacidiphilum fumarolicum]
MKYRHLPGTEIEASVIGFGLWTLTTGWWGTYTEAEAIRLLKEAYDLGINFFDTADVYGHGYGEEILAKAFPNSKDVVIATKIGYNFYNEVDRSAQQELPQDFSVPFLKEALHRSLKRLKRDYIDNLQLHNIRLAHVKDDAIWQFLEDQLKEGTIRSYGVALGPAIGWLYEGLESIRLRKPHIVQHIYNILESYPGKELMSKAAWDQTRYLIRVPHASGMLEGHYTPQTKFSQTDHRRFRPKHWLQNGLKKIATLQFLVLPNRSLGQAALQWILNEKKVLSCLPNIYNSTQLKEFAQAPDCPPLTKEELDKIDSLIASNFGVEEEAEAYKGTMTLEQLHAASQ